MKFYSFANILMLQFVAFCILFAPVFLIPPLSRRDMPYPVKYSFDWSSSPIFDIMALIQIYGYHSVNVSSIIGTDLFFISIGSCMVIQYRLLQQCLLKYCTPEMIVINKKLKNFGNDNDNDIDDERRQYFIKCVEHHKMLQRYRIQILC
ncbi:unnamed protein product [Phyllotreta striolata]|uniref:Uncharacterized protein n=1 Tax=Phyllotreta striolata TaxID=444603 RepID=A0A9N9XJ60_PHYSR|nr:unnamed protein product [Phyllotreta striolata]